MINFIIVLSVLVLFHELGHYLAARYFNVTVESFSIGFGPRLFGFRHDGTDFKVCLLPLGGYVKMAGQSVVGEATGEPGELPSKPRWQRLVIVGMGPLFNFLLAIALLAGLYTVRYERARFLDEEARVGYVSPGSAADAAGVRAGDVVRSVDGAAVPTWKDLMMATALAAGREVGLAVERGGEAQNLRIALPGEETAQELVDPGWSAAHRVRIGDVLGGSPAASAGVEPGDVLLRVDGAEIVALQQVIDVIGGSGGRPMSVEVERGGSFESLTVAADREDDSQPWRMGVHLLARYERVDEPLSLGQALARSTSDNIGFAGLIFRTLGALVTGDLSVKALEGPVGIYRHTQDAASQGAGGLIQLMAVISVNLGILNLLPIPVLDGGHIVLLLVESLLRRDVSAEVKSRIIQAGLVFLVILFGIVMYNDISRQFFSP